MPDIVGEIPILPVFEPGLIFFVRRTKCSTVLDKGKVNYMSSGRIAIARSLELCGVTAGDEILLPAYHCPSMVDPVEWLGAHPVYYRINNDTSANIQDIQSRITHKTKAILAVHNFGFPQDLKELHKICKENDLYLLEDCSHAFYVGTDDPLIGVYGDFLIASPRKFFSMYDGGCLVELLNLPMCVEQQKKPGIKFNIKSLYNIIETAVSYSRLTGLKPLFQAVQFVRKNDNSCNSASSLSSSKESNETSSYQDERFMKENIHVSMSFVSKAVMKTQLRAKYIVEKRRQYYKRYLDELSNIPGVTPLFNSMNHPCIVPYMFPLVVNDADELYPELRKKNIPVWRWEYLKTSICPVSNRYGRTVLQFPCHQSLRNSEFQRIVAAIKEQVKQ